MSRWHEHGTAVWHGHEAWGWASNVGMVMQHRHGHAVPGHVAQAWTCGMGIVMCMGMGMGMWHGYGHGHGHRHSARTRTMGMWHGQRAQLSTVDMQQGRVTSIQDRLTTTWKGAFLLHSHWKFLLSGHLSEAAYATYGGNSNTNQTEFISLCCFICQPE